MLQTQNNFKCSGWILFKQVKLGEMVFSPRCNWKEEGTRYTWGLIYKTDIGRNQTKSGTVAKMPVLPLIFNVGGALMLQQCGLQGFPKKRAKFRKTHLLEKCNLTYYVRGRLPAIRPEDTHRHARIVAFQREDGKETHLRCCELFRAHPQPCYYLCAPLYNPQEWW